MNKIESIWHFEMSEIPTLTINIIDRKEIEQSIKDIFHPFKLGWVARSGGKPSPQLNSRPDGFMPWNKTDPLDKYSDPEQQFAELVCQVEEIYRLLNDNQVAFIHHQRQFDKSGVLRVDNTTATVEAVVGWPEQLSHGTVNPIVRYVFNLPSLFITPSKVDGDGSFLTPQELYWIGSKIERKLDYKTLLENLSDPLAVEFSFGPYKWGYNISAHDIMAGKAKKFKTWYQMAKSIRERVREARLPEDKLAQLVEESFEEVLKLLDEAKHIVTDVGKELGRLNAMYDISGFNGAPDTSLGSAKWEGAIELFLEPSKNAGILLPIKRDKYEAEIKAKGWHYEDSPYNPYDYTISTMETFLERDYMTNIRMPQGDYLLPTDELLQVMQVPQREFIN